MNTIFEHKTVNIFLPISFNICFGCSKEYPQQCFGWEIRQLVFRYTLLIKVLSLYLSPDPGSLKVMLCAVFLILFRIPWVKHIILPVKKSYLPYVLSLVDENHYEKVSVIEGSSSRHRSIYQGVLEVKRGIQNFPIARSWWANILRVKLCLFSDKSISITLSLLAVTFVICW